MVDALGDDLAGVGWQSGGELGLINIDFVQGLGDLNLVEVGHKISGLTSFE